MTPTDKIADGLPFLKIKRNYPDAPIPVRAHDTDSCFDVQAYSFSCLYCGSAEVPVIPSAEYVDLWPGNRVLVNTGLSATVGVGYEIQMRPRSGLALKKGLIVVNTPGTIDEPYRGAIGVIIGNIGSDQVRITRWERIAQMGVYPVILSKVLIVDELDDTERGSDGFGSTGV